MSELKCCLYCRRCTWHWYSCTLCSERLEHVRTFLPSPSLFFILPVTLFNPHPIFLVFLQGSHHILHPPPWTALPAQSHISRDCKRVGGRLWYGKQPTQHNLIDLLINICILLCLEITRRCWEEWSKRWVPQCHLWDLVPQPGLLLLLRARAWVRAPVLGWYCQFLLTGLQCKAEDMMVVEPSEPVMEVFGGEGEEESAGGSELEEDMVSGLSIMLATKGWFQYFNCCDQPSHMVRSLRWVIQKAARRWRRRRRCRVRWGHMRYPNDSWWSADLSPLTFATGGRNDSFDEREETQVISWFLQTTTHRDHHTGYHV